MTDKDNASMTTVQMKADYAASEVYSTASEPPPLGLFNFNPLQAYKRQSNSVKIAKITAFTVIISSFILGSFILASSYLQAKASCDQVQALDSVLEKELMLETLQQVNKELPRAEALMGRETNDDNDLQNLDREQPVKKVETKVQKSSNVIPAAAAVEEETNNNENNYLDSEEADEMQKYPGKLPLELDLSDLAAALLQNNKKSRMNCVVERKHAEELVDSPSKTVTLPFGMNLTTDPKKARITGERISIFCEGGNENKEHESAKTHKNREEEDDNDDDTESVRPMFIPIQRVPIPFGPIPHQYPLTHMPHRAMPPQMQHQMQTPQIQTFLRQMPPPLPPFQQLPMRPPMPPQVMQAPPQPELQQQQQQQPQQRIVRIHVQQIPMREVIHTADDVPIQIATHNMAAAAQQQQQHQQHIQAQPPTQHQIHEPQLTQQQQHQQQQQQPIQRQEMPFLQIQRMPLGMALQHAGITAEDLANIQRMTEERMSEVLRHLTTESDEDNSNSSEEDEDDTQTRAQPANGEEKIQEQQSRQLQQQQQHLHQQQQLQGERQARMQELPMQRLILQPLPEQPRDIMTPPIADQTMSRLPIGHTGYGRSLAQPVRIPVPMVQAQPDLSTQEDQSSVSSSISAALEESERHHFVQPRSV
ncbi:putative mediator of RNA polymerase II transcription subunit 26 isoform X1 [Glossina fuscipes]|uniref:Mediator of RNA polymerase II transcription subunit 26 isoform X1 n=2 Tax=Glossina fuscipes TaxID=7396 RepID=A0A9C6DSZ0_9MUSC|nr:putative mediator of RNA polymerase II transcription subunit 26 isoform X1 [Glossina fuscipes]